MRTQAFQKSQGFTLIELLVVILVVGILGAIITRLIDVKRQQDVAEDAVRLATVEKLAEVIETFCSLEGTCPAADGPGDPDLAPDDTNFLTNYLTQWPDGTPDAAVYSYGTTGADFRVSIANTTGAGGYKYWSGWGEVRDCLATSLNRNNGTCN